MRQEIQAADPTVEVELVEVTTTGDQKRDWSLEKQGGTGLFTKELESLLLDGVADIAVHSSKDLPAKLVDGLAKLVIFRANKLGVLFFDLKSRSPPEYR